MWKLAAAGSLAGALSGGLCNPAELAMVRMQADRGKPVERECQAVTGGAVCPRHTVPTALISLLLWPSSWPARIVRARALELTSQKGTTTGTPSRRSFA